HTNMHTRCFFKDRISDFLKRSYTEVFGTIVQSFHGNDSSTTNEAWLQEVEIMQEVLQPWRHDDAYIFFEYDIPRLGKRVDVVLLIRGVIFCLEFKVGKREALQADLEQVLDYALDLKNFHLYSSDRPIAPILVPTEYTRVTNDIKPSAYDDAIFNPLIAGRSHLQQVIESVLEVGATQYDEQKWGFKWLISPYSPTPTIIEAARTLYENHSVEDITRHEADKVSTDATIAYILSVIDQSKQRGEKSICFVTGVPGAGKTLVGLDVAIKQSYKDGMMDKENGAVYLSGNGPLVAVLTEALAIDNRKKCVERGEKKNITDSRREVSEFLQIIHRYRDNMLAKIKNPVENGRLEIDPSKAVSHGETGYGEVEHVAIFDEAQRSWTHKRLADYLKRGGTYGNKLKVPNFPVSEASFLIWSLDQRRDWAVIVCLVGGGQEINTGEAGIVEWIKALNEEYTHWKVYISNKLTEPEYAEGRVNELLRHNANVTFSESLHLAVSLRSFRAETLSSFVHSLLAFKRDADELYRDVDAKGYPIVLTRDINKARTWLREKARGSQQTGILVTKVAARFKPQAVTVLAQGDENAVHWFLEDKTDVRSSNYLEEAATEIQVQGLELDYACVLWDADMQCSGNEWKFFKFNGRNKWNPENNPENRSYMLNAYRVLLTRARQGLVICVPEGNSRLNSEGKYEDATRLPEFYDGTYRYFESLGIKKL
ncbi:MAG: DNA/RNA helicase domain-containing protein, partial [Muribaculaceae bacterium]